MLASHSRVALLKPVKHTRQQFRANTDSRVGNFYYDMLAFTAKFHLDVAARRSKLHGVAQQVPYHLLYPIGIRANDPHLRACTVAKLHFLTDRQWADRLNRCPDSIGKASRAKLNTQFSGSHARDIQQLINELFLRKNRALECPPTFSTVFLRKRL